ncbi:MAG: substrate-binding domain-containing protein [Actinobacteria bacterium]|nr:substrate-binding domain-containing protein [Actinomycetota bacterium]
MAVTLKDIAKKVGVHPSTVSRVLSGKYDNFNVSEKTRKLIFETVKKFNYSPNEMARNLRLQKTQTIGLIIPDILNPFYAGMARSLGIECEKKDYSFIICNTDEIQEKEINFIQMLKRRRIEGLVITPVQDSKDHFEELIEENFPFVLASRYFDDFETNAVVTDDYNDVFKAVEYLIKLGHSRIGFIRGRKASSAIQDREKGYKGALAKYNMQIDQDLIVGNGCTIEGGYKATKEILNLPEKPTALLVSANVIVVGALEAIFEAGLSVPDDVSVVGFTNMKSTPYLSYPLTSISQPIGQLGKRAFDLLFQHIQSPDEHKYKKIILPSKFSIGKSTQKALGS